MDDTDIFFNSIPIQKCTNTDNNSSSRSARAEENSLYVHVITIPLNWLQEHCSTHMQAGLYAMLAMRVCTCSRIHHPLFIWCTNCSGMYVNAASVKAVGGSPHTEYKPGEFVCGQRGTLTILLKSRRWLTSCTSVSQYRYYSGIDTPVPDRPGVCVLPLSVTLMPSFISTIFFMLLWIICGFIREIAQIGSKCRTREQDLKNSLFNFSPDHRKNIRRQLISESSETVSVHAAWWDESKLQHCVANPQNRIIHKYDGTEHKFLSFLCTDVLSVNWILSFFPSTQCHPTPSHTFPLEVRENLFRDLYSLIINTPTHDDFGQTKRLLVSWAALVGKVDMTQRALSYTWSQAQRLVSWLD